MPSPLPPQLDPVDMSAVYARHPILERVETRVNHRLQGRARIVELLSKAGTGAEIGVFTGVFSEFLIAKAKPKRLYLVDPWSKLFGPYFPGGVYFGNGELSTEAAKEAVRLRARRCPDAAVIEDFGLSWLATVPALSLDWVYLDSSHAYDDTMAELKALAPRMTMSGIIAGDDAWTNRASRHIGVFHALRDFCQTSPFELFRLDHHGQWALRRRIT